MRWIGPGVGAGLKITPQLAPGVCGVGSRSGRTQRQAAMRPSAPASFSTSTASQVRDIEVS